MSIYANTNENVQRFIEHVQCLCDEHEVTLDIRNTKFIWMDGSRVAGYFDSNVPEMRVAGNHPHGLKIFAHEFGHMTQWIDKRSIWYKDSLDHNKLDTWLKGNTVHHIEQIIDEISAVEHDNEIRTVALIKKFKLPIDVKQYIKEANAYLFFYQHLKNTRRWSRPNNSPYGNKEIVNACPTKFLVHEEYPDYFRKLQSIYEEQGI